jgi:hypothetical protein
MIIEVDQVEAWCQRAVDKGLSITQALKDQDCGHAADVQAIERLRAGHQRVRRVSMRRPGRHQRRSRAWLPSTNTACGMASRLASSLVERGHPSVVMTSLRRIDGWS